MTTPDSVLLESMEEARRLWEAAVEARSRNDLGSLCTALDLGPRAVEVLATHRLRPVAAKFPATIGMRLEAPDPAVVPDRDAAHAPPVLTFIEVLDLLSNEDLSCAAPALHSGWEDRRFSCARSRTTARTATGVSLTREDRDSLVLLAACRNRVFRLPPPVRLEPPSMVAAYPALERLYEALSRSRP